LTKSKADFTGSERYLPVTRLTGKNEKKSVFKFWSDTRNKKPFDDTMSELRLRQNISVSFKKTATLEFNGTF
jgi:hypothetical protein